MTEPVLGSVNTGGVKEVVVHPIVLLSVVDHYNRVAKATSKRVVGVLLGEKQASGTVDVVNCYAVPFDEDERNPNIWYLDHNYHENMRDMLRRVSANEKVVGWYSSGPRMKPSDLDIHRLIMQYATEPVFVIVDVRPNGGDSAGIPTEAYTAIESIQNEGEEPQLSFQHLPSRIGAMEVEEIGVEHLLRDVKDTNISTLTTQVHQMVSSLGGLLGKLRSIHQYLKHVTEGRIPVNYRIMYQLQNILNYLPNLSTPDLTTAISSKTNDMMLVVYLSSMIRSIIALHNLINNKLELKEEEEKEKGSKKATAATSDDKEKKSEGANAAAGGKDK